MRIVHLVATGSGWGGLEFAVAEIVTTQAKQGRDTVLVACPDVCKQLPAYVKRVVFDFRASRYNPVFLRKLTRVLQTLHPDILHVHANKGAAIARRVAPFLPETKRVATIHNTKKRTAVFKGMDAVIAVSRKAGECLGGLEHTVIWNAIKAPAPDTPSPADLPRKAHGRFTVASYGRFVAAKGFNILLEAVAPLEDVDLWLVGDGKLQTPLKRQVMRLGLKERVWLPGFRSDCEAIVSKADLFVLPSLREGFPLALVQMLHREVPVLATRVAGAEEILPDDCLVEVGDVSALRERLRWTMKNREDHRALMEPVYRLAKEKLEIGYYCERLDEVYASVL